MKTHNYSLTIEWTGNEGTGTSTYTSYKRNYDISGKSKYSEIKGSSDPAFRGDPKRYNPEDLLVASLSSCHMLCYLHLCAVNNIVVLKYIDNAFGTMEENANGGGKFNSVVLRPSVTISSNSDREKALKLHHEANQLCFIANSCNFKVDHEPSIIMG